LTSVSPSRQAGFADGQGIAARFNLPMDIAVDSLGKAVPGEPMTSMLKPPGINPLELYCDKLMSILLRFCFLIQHAPLHLGDVFIADYLNNRIRQITIAEGEVTTIAAGSAGAYTRPLLSTS
jgi:hypothetical protein